MQAITLRREHRHGGAPVSAVLEHELMTRLRPLVDTFRDDQLERMDRGRGPLVFCSLDADGLPDQRSRSIDPEHPAGGPSSASRSRARRSRDAPAMEQGSADARRGAPVGEGRGGRAGRVLAVHGRLAVEVRLRPDQGRGAVVACRRTRRPTSSWSGPVPAGMWLLHECDNPLCCNPRHQRPGTAAENRRDQFEHGAFAKRAA